MERVIGVEPTTLCLATMESGEDGNENRLFFAAPSRSPTLFSPNIPDQKCGVRTWIFRKSRCAAGAAWHPTRLPKNQPKWKEKKA
jgi:hypothetical protein